LGQPVEITKVEYSAADLRRLASREKRGAVVRRILALAMILEGHSRTEAVAMNGMGLQTLRDWVHRYNAEGLEGVDFSGDHAGSAIEVSKDRANGSLQAA
jgi:hypothetical protein